MIMIMIMIIACLLIHKTFQPNQWEISSDVLFLVDENCRTVEFKEERKSEVLINHVSHRYYGVDQDICQINCYREPGCVSYNHGTLSDGTFLCELNDKDHTQASSNEMVARYGFIYRPILVRDDVINNNYSPKWRWLVMEI